jgi:endo-1,4-beta-mannosidase
MGKLISFALLVTCFNVYAFDNFITRKGHQLFDGEKTFRFAGIHAPELHRIENDAKGKCPQDSRGWGQYFQWPTRDEQENWIKALTGTGHKAMRIYVLSVEDPSDKPCLRQTHILKPSESGAMPNLNEQAMQVYDRMIALAHLHKLRLILPFIDHWEWWGGRKQLAAFYGEQEDDFYDINSQSYAAYLDIIRQVITRKNTVTGRYYFEEKAIMAWETGNELKDTNKAFLAKTAAHIDTLAPNQMIIDGTYLAINDFAINNPHVDIISNHFYTVNGNNNPNTIKRNLKQIGGKKAYIVGEFGLEDSEILEDIIDTAVHHDVKGAKTVGAFIWGFRGHRHDGGFYFHKEGTGHYSYRLPGFKESDNNQENAIIDTVRRAIAGMNGSKVVTPLAVPEAPKLRLITSPKNIKWMGSPLGRNYRIERSEKKMGPWRVIADNISDGKPQFDPAIDTLFSDDDTLKISKPYFYRVVAKNESGESKPSNIQSLIIDPTTADKFVKVQNGQFIKNGKPYYFIGTNYWYGPLLGASKAGLARMRIELDDMQANGIDNLRVLVGAEQGDYPQMVSPALQYQQGQYNESLFRGLDHLLVEMKKRNMLAVLYLNNNWIWSGGMAQYLNWNGYGTIPNPFLEQYSWQDYMDYTKQFHQCKPCKTAFLKHINKVIGRKNSLSGTKYKNDPTIMSWQVANEPRVFDAVNEEHFSNWLNAVVEHISVLAPEQLISTGNEGTAGSVNDMQIYQRIHQNPKIDYLTMHIWPKNWSWYDPKNESLSLLVAIRKATEYINQHIETANKLNKPIVLSEFGFPRDQESLSPEQSTSNRNQFYQELFSQIEDSYAQQGTFAGCNFWGYAGIGKAGKDLLADPPQEPQGLNSVFSSDKQTLEIIRKFNARLQ